MTFLNNNRALITGASSGLGAEFARQLAPRAQSLALVARRETELHALAAELKAAHPALTVHVFPCDLADSTARAALAGRCAAAGFAPNVLVNNAGFGDYGAFDSAEWATLERMISVNVTAVAHLAHLFLPALKAGAPSGILNVSSLAGEMPIPDFALYAATKACVTRLNEALRIELKEHRIHVTALCPGPVKTGFGEAARRSGGSISVASWAYQPAKRVVRLALTGLEKNRATVFPGAIVWWTARLVKLLPAPVLRLLLSRRPRRTKR